MTNFAILSLIDNVEKLQAKVNRVQKSYNSLKDKTSWFASEHEKLLAADLECLAVYKRHLAAAQQSVQADVMPCGHPQSAVVEADEGTAYCSLCEASA